MLIPKPVYDEVVKSGAGLPGSKELATASWCQLVVPPANSVIALQTELPQLGTGEVSAIAYALEHHADLVMMDDLAARRAAQRRGLTVKGTMGLLVEAKSKGQLALIGPVIQELLDAGAWLDSALTKETLRLAGESDKK